MVFNQSRLTIVLTLINNEYRASRSNSVWELPEPSYRALIVVALVPLPPDGVPGTPGPKFEPDPLSVSHGCSPPAMAGTAHKQSRASTSSKLDIRELLFICVPPENTLDIFVSYKNRREPRAALPEGVATPAATILVSLYTHVKQYLTSRNNCDRVTCGALPAAERGIEWG